MHNMSIILIYSTEETLRTMNFESFPSKSEKSSFNGPPFFSFSSLTLQMNTCNDDDETHYQEMKHFHMLCTEVHKYGGETDLDNLMLIVSLHVMMALTIL